MKYKHKLISGIICAALGAIACTAIFSSCSLGECEHTYGKWTVTVEPTCIEPGKQVRICSKCEEKQTEEINEEKHDERVVKGYPATCTSEGLSDGRHCLLCKKDTVIQEVIPFAPHNEQVIPGHAATCKYTGMTDGGTCKDCGAVTREQTVIETLPHTPMTIEGYPATCYKMGQSNFERCSVCYLNLSEPKDIPVVEHKYANGICPDCGDRVNANRDLEIVITSDGCEVVGLGTCTATDIIIPSVHRGIPVTSIDGRAFKGNKNITSIVLPDTVTLIGTSLFEDCTSLRSVTIGRGVKTIYKNAFKNCTSLSEVIGGEGVETINEFAFENCTSLKYVRFESAFRILHAFYGCTALEEAILPSVGSVSNTFNGCTALKRVELGKPGKQLLLSDYTFTNCTSLTQIILNGDLEVISFRALQDCPSVTSVTLPATLVRIDSIAFFNCTSLSQIRFEGTTEQWKKVQLEPDWYQNCPITEIICIDGTIKLN